MPTPEFLLYDFAGDSGQVSWNRGCPRGYAAQFSAAVSAPALAMPAQVIGDALVPLDPNQAGLWPDGTGTLAVRCVRVDVADPVAEAAPFLGQQLTMDAAALSEQALTAAREAAGAALGLVGSGLLAALPWLLVALGVYAAASSWGRSR